MMSLKKTPIGLSAGLLILVLVAAGCRKDEGVGVPVAVDSGTPPPFDASGVPRDVALTEAAAPDGGASADGAGATDASGAVETGPAPKPFYAFSTIVFGDMSETTYVNILDSLDIKGIDITKAREFPGRVSIATVNGWLFVSDADSPIVTRFSIDDAGNLKESGKLSFANFGFDSLFIDEWGNTFISPTKAYLFNAADGNHIIWDPTKMEIVGEIKSPELVREKLDLDGSPAVLRGNRLYKTIFWKDWDAYMTSADQFLAVYDVEHDKLLELTKETRCPGLNNRVEKDDKGNLYFSNWIYNVTETLVRGAPKSCALRMSAGAATLDADWKLSFADITMGREAAGVNHLRNGQGIFAVFHHERVTINAETDPQKLALSPNWRLWSIDLTTGKSAGPVEGIDWLAGGYSVINLESRSFVFVPGADYASTKVFEVGADGKAALAFDLRGWSYQLVKVK